VTVIRLREPREVEMKPIAIQVSQS